MVLLILTVGFILRIILSFLPSFAIDMGTFIAWGEKMIQAGPVGFYSKEVFTNYLPGYLYVLWFLAAVRNFFQIPPNSTLYEIILKLPANLADLATAFLIFKIVKNYFGQNKAILATIFYIFNPAIIFNSAVWGQNDSIFTFFLLLSAYFLVETKKPLIASLFYGLSLTLKPQVVAFLPILTLYLFWQYKIKTFLGSILVSIILIFLISLPFFTKNPILGFPTMILQMSDYFPYTSLFAFNFWWIFGGWQNDLSLSFGLSTQIWGILLWISAQIIILIWLFKNRSKENFFLAAAISLLAFFVLPTRVHERYLFPFFAFGAVSAGIFGKKLLWAIYGILTLIHFFNLYFVYNYYNPNFLKITQITDIIGKLSLLLSVVTVFIFGLTVGFLFKKPWQKT